MEQAMQIITERVALYANVVVHELSHITYKNHSPAFWARVKLSFRIMRRLRRG